MSEYPWDIENMMLAQHEQPCDCAICDEIHFNRETRRQKRRTATDPDCLVKSVNAAWERATGANYPAHAEAIINGLRAVIVAESKNVAYAQSKWADAESRLESQRDKCNIYNCMDRKDLKMRIEQLENMHKEIVKECINIIKDYDKEGDAEATLCGYVFAPSVVCAIKRKFGLEI
ncbi:MAG: hypothetical protein PHI31_09690 [Desulfuromonadaceae bacterium]|nr:hypothetical protein [Desulfuromonadaceae bacterium]